MSAVIRIKRHIDEEPLSELLLSKRQRVVEQSATILKFSGTLEKPDDLSEHMMKLTKEDAKELITKVPPVGNGRLERNRAQQKQMAQDNRFKIVNCTRTLDEETASSSVTVLDVEKTEPVSAITNVPAEQNPDKSTSANDKYVYDVYVMENNNERIASDNLLDVDDYSVLEYVENPFGTFRDNNSDAEDDEESNDSNDENYYANDYPDEDDGEGYSEGENDMRRAIADFDIDDDLSSDEEDVDENSDSENSEFVYSLDSEAAGFEGDIDYSVDRSCSKYNKYKTRKRSSSDEDFNYSGDIDPEDFSD